MKQRQFNDERREPTQTKTFSRGLHNVKKTSQKRLASSHTDPDESFSDVIITSPTQRTKRYCLIKQLKKSDNFQSILAVERQGPAFDRLVFVKRMNASHDRSEMQLLKHAFLNEARTMAALNHPQIPQILNVQQKNEKVSVVMEYVNGQTFDSVVSNLSRTGDFLPIPIACGLMEQLCGAVHFVHNAGDFTGENPGVIHRNIDLKSLMVDSNGYAKIIDLGIVKNYVQKKEQSQALTEDMSIWKAPELRNKENYDHRADIYSLGLVLYSLLVGKNPIEKIHDTTSLEENINPAHILSLTGSVLFDELHEIIATATHPDPLQRYQTAELFRKAIVRAANKHDGLAAPGEIRAYLGKRFREQITRNSRFDQAVLAKGRAKLEATENPACHEERRSSPATSLPKAIRKALTTMNLALSRAKNVNPSNPLFLGGFLIFYFLFLGLSFFHDTKTPASSTCPPPEAALHSSMMSDPILVDRNHNSCSSDLSLQSSSRPWSNATRQKNASKLNSKLKNRKRLKNKKRRKAP